MAADTDIDACLAAGEDVFEAGGVSSATMLFEDDAVQGATPEGAGIVLGSGYVLVRASLYPDLSVGDPVSVNGQVYPVAQQPMRIQDGRVLQVWLGKADD